VSNSRHAQTLIDTMLNEIKQNGNFVCDYPMEMNRARVLQEAIDHLLERGYVVNSSKDDDVIITISR
jgi:hypothetical protein